MRKFKYIGPYGRPADGDWVISVESPDGKEDFYYPEEILTDGNQHWVLVDVNKEGFERISSFYEEDFSDKRVKCALCDATNKVLFTGHYGPTCEDCMESLQLGK